ncbi:MAG: hypothetical protein P8Y26_16550 [Gemmatimonadales bacterium]
MPIMRPSAEWLAMAVAYRSASSARSASDTTEFTTPHCWSSLAVTLRPVIIAS